MSSHPSQGNAESGANPVVTQRWLRLVALQRRLWITFALFLIAPFAISVLTGSDALAMALAAALVVAALWTTRKLTQAQCPSCGSSYFSREENGRRTYNNFSSSCMSCGWSSTQ